MMGLSKREVTEPVLSRIISSAEPVTGAWWMPGIWVGTGCDLAGVEAGTEADADRLEELVQASGGAFDIAVPEPAEIRRAADARGAGRDAVWFTELLKCAAEILPSALAQVFEHDEIGVNIRHARFVAALYAHPAALCMETTADRYHVHCIVPGLIACDCPHPHPHLP
ncbi:MAG: hypothetical protein ACRDRJ_03140 [Streptosporangiaceae bacterium]